MGIKDNSCPLVDPLLYFVNREKTSFFERHCMLWLLALFLPIKVSKIWFMIIKVQILYGNKKLSKKLLLRNIKEHFIESFFLGGYKGAPKSLKL